MEKTFGQCRDEWLGRERSDRINYCMPVSIGVIAQNVTEYDETAMAAAVGKIMKQLGRWFGKFSASSDTPSHNRLIVMTTGGNRPTGQILQLLQKNYGAKAVYADEESIKKYCWIIVAAWDGIADPQSPVYQTIRGILSTADTPSDDYVLRFPDNRPVFQIVLPDPQGTLPGINYKVREIYPHTLETINDTEPWFSRSRFVDPTARLRRKDAKRRNFRANAAKIKRFNKKIAAFSKHADAQSENLYDLLPWHHQDGKQLPDYVESANLREIYYDLISMQAQKRQNTQNRILMALAFLAMLCFSAYSDLISDLKGNSWLLIGYLVLIGVCYLFYWIFIKGMNAHNRYLEFRSLAEGMRVQCYWYAAGINESVGESYTVKFQKDMLWATQAFKAWYVTDYLMQDSADGTARLKAPLTVGYKPDYDRVRVEWLGTLPQKDAMGNYAPELPEGCPDGLPEQLGFYTRRIEKFASKNRRSRRLTIGIAVAAVILSAVLAFFIRQNGFEQENWFLFAIGVINLLSLMVTTNNHLNAYEELASKYAYCQLLAQKALQDYVADPAKARQILKQFGVEALEENAEWLMIKNDREPAVPQ